MKEATLKALVSICDSYRVVKGTIAMQKWLGNLNHYNVNIISVNGSRFDHAIV